MTLDFWIHAERFYEFWFFILSVGIIFCGIVMIFIYSYAKEKNRKRNLLIPMSIALILGVFGLLGHYRYHPYLEQASYITPLIRDRVPRLATYVYYGSLEESYYRDLNALESLRKMVLYEEELVTEPVIYLGEGEYFHYFEQSNGDLFKQNRQVEFTDTTDKPQVVGGHFTLKNEAFQEIGFKNPENTMFERIEIPASEQGKTYEPEDDFQIPQTKEKFVRWNF